MVCSALPRCTYSPAWESTVGSELSETLSRTNAPEQSVCRAYWHSGSSMVSCKAPTAATSPLREEKSEVCSSMRSVISSERWTPMTETFRHREVISERKAPIWKVRAFSVSARGLLSCPSRSRATNSTASSRSANAPMYRNSRRRMEGCACFSFESRKPGIFLRPPSRCSRFFQRMEQNKAQASSASASMSSPAAARLGSSCWSWRRPS